MSRTITLNDALNSITAYYIKHPITDFVTLYNRWIESISVSLEKEEDYHIAISFCRDIIGQNPDEIYPIIQGE